MVSSEKAIEIIKDLDADGIAVWVLGGWGIDALLEKQTRPHKDLDLLAQLDDVASTCVLLRGKGFGLKEIWSENRWAVDWRGLQILTAFVLIDGRGRELDFHAMRLDEQGNGLPCWETEVGFVFTKEDLKGEGHIHGFPVRCITPEKQMQCHAGYELPEKQIPDLLKLWAKFGVKLPKTLHRLNLLGESG